MKLNGKFFRGLVRFKTVSDGWLQCKECPEGGEASERTFRLLERNNEIQYRRADL